MNDTLPDFVVSVGSVGVDRVPRRGGRGVQPEGLPGDGVEVVALLKVLVGGGFLRNDFCMVVAFRNGIDPVFAEVFQNLVAGLLECLGVQDEQPKGPGDRRGVDRDDWG